MKKMIFVGVCLTVFSYSSTAFAGARDQLPGGPVYVPEPPPPTRVSPPEPNPKSPVGGRDNGGGPVPPVTPGNPSPGSNAQDTDKIKKKLEADKKLRQQEAEAREAEQKRRHQAAAMARAQWATDDSTAFADIFDNTSNGADMLSVPTMFTPPAEATKGKPREELLADLVLLRGDIEATKNQLLKLNKAIQSDTAQYNEWEKATNDEMLGAVKTGFDMLFDFADDRVKEHYEELVKVAREQHKSAADFRLELQQLQAIRRTKGFVDGIFLAGKEHDTWVKKLEAVRDALGLISGELGEKPASKLLGESFAKYARFAAPYWKYGSAIADAAYAITLYYFDWQAAKQLDRNNESFRLAVEKLGNRMSALVTELKDTEAQLKERNQQ